MYERFFHRIFKMAYSKEKQWKVFSYSTKDDRTSVRNKIRETLHIRGDHWESQTHIRDIMISLIEDSDQVLYMAKDILEDVQD